ncbi:MAG: nuclear transport factor 2 family protein [Burkholderiales bacterium]|jgi:ketosteroid isomerase-like protein|nr:nuclear transport factor 2 family protein [Burkholderiales bacterium]MCA3215797.1 nuclear transport factor 2 family protein [Burkholderiales bacterium]MCA3225071.1 nuclear transport factor 2 family protein [Burkholderiales bacterium]MCE2643976.1 nuclear transport factor 2 family protein [Burkholderiaceae bacterium]
MSRLTKPLLFASPVECEQAFYDALEAADAEALCELWLDDDDVVCVHPNGPRLVGSGAVRASWTAILANGAVNIRAASRKAVETPTVAVHNVVEQVLMTQGRRQQIVHVIATNAYVKTPAGWKMVLHHAAPAPEGKAEDIEAPAGPLH